MPARAVFAAPAKIDADIDPALADPVDDVQINERIIIGWQDRIVVAAIAIHQRRGTAGLFQRLRDCNVTITINGIYIGLDLLRMPFPVGPRQPEVDGGREGTGIFFPFRVEEIEEQKV